MTNKHITYILLALLVIIVIGFFATQTTNNQSGTNGNRQSNYPPTNTNVDNNEAAEQNTATPSPDRFKDYDAEQIANSDAEHIILFFHANWCPSCKALEEDIKANQASIPDNMEIYKVSFDTATELKSRYGVRVQHSLLEINQNGEAESTILHSSTLASLVNSITN